MSASFRDFATELGGRIAQARAQRFEERMRLQLRISCPWQVCSWMQLAVCAGASGEAFVTSAQPSFGISRQETPKEAWITLYILESLQVAHASGIHKEA